MTTQITKAVELSNRDIAALDPFCGRYGKFNDICFSYRGFQMEIEKLKDCGGNKNLIQGITWAFRDSENPYIIKVGASLISDLEKHFQEYIDRNISEYLSKMHRPPESVTYTVTFSNGNVTFTHKR